MLHGNQNNDCFLEFSSCSSSFVPRSSPFYGPLTALVHAPSDASRGILNPEEYQRALRNAFAQCQGYEFSPFALPEIRP
jgi:hypothetical protein